MQGTRSHKKGKGAISVLKRDGSCVAQEKSDYCSEHSSIDQVLQDDGLIFADGEKENISTKHGQVYCAYLLVRSYLERGFIFNRNKEYQGILSASKTELTPKENILKEEKPVEKIDFSIDSQKIQTELDSGATGSFN